MTNLDLLEAMNGITDETVLHTQHLLEHEEKHSVNKSKKFWRTALIAAVITCLLSVTAYAAVQFTMSGHRPEEKSFTVEYGAISHEVPMEYVFEFQGPTECPEVQFKTNWTPTEDYWGFVGPQEDGWASLLEANEIYNETYQLYQPGCVIDVMYAPQFVDGGAMILSGWAPDAITEEIWEQVQAYKFTATATHPMNPEGTAFATGNFVILFHPEEGWIIGVRGYDSMENIEQIARNLEVRQSGGTIRSSDFETPFADCDIYIG